MKPTSTNTPKTLVAVSAGKRPHPLSSPPAPWVKVKGFTICGSCGDGLENHLVGEALVFARGIAERSDTMDIARFYNPDTERTLLIVIELALDKSINPAAFTQTDLDRSHRIAIPPEFEPLLAQLAAEIHEGHFYL